MTSACSVAKALDIRVGPGYKRPVELPPVLGSVEREPVVLLVPGRAALAQLAGMSSVARHVAMVERMGMEPVVVFPARMRTLGAEVSGEIPDETRCIDSEAFSNLFEDEQTVLVLAADWYVSFRAVAVFCRETHGIAAARFNDRGRIVAPFARLRVRDVKTFLPKLAESPSGQLISTAAGTNATIYTCGVKSRHRLSDNVAIERAEAKLFSSLNKPGRLPIVDVMQKYLPLGATRRLARTGAPPLAVSAIKFAAGVGGAALLANTTFSWTLAGALLLCLTRTLDGSASEIARARILRRSLVEKVDLFGDIAVFILCVTAIASRVELGPPVGKLAMVATIGIVTSAAMTYLLVLQDRWATLDGTGFIPSPANDFASRFTNRGGATYALIPAVLIRRLDLFLWAAAIASHLFYLLLLRTRTKAGG